MNTVSFLEHIELSESLDSMVEFEMTEDSIIGKRASYIFMIDDIEYGVTLTKTNWQSVWELDAYRIMKSGTKTSWRIPKAAHFIPFLSTVLDCTTHTFKMWKSKIHGVTIPLPKKFKNLKKIERIADRIIKRNHLKWLKRVKVVDKYIPIEGAGAKESPDSIFLMRKTKKISEVFSSKKFKDYIFGDEIDSALHGELKPLIRSKIKASRSIIFKGAEFDIQKDEVDTDDEVVKAFLNNDPSIESARIIDLKKELPIEDKIEKNVVKIAKESRVNLSDPLDIFILASLATDMVVEKDHPAPIAERLEYGFLYACKILNSGYGTSNHKKLMMQLNAILCKYISPNDNLISVSKNVLIMLDYYGNFKTDKLYSDFTTYDIIWNYIQKKPTQLSYISLDDIKQVFAKFGLDRNTKRVSNEDIVRIGKMIIGGTFKNVELYDDTVEEIYAKKKTSGAAGIEETLVKRNVNYSSVDLKNELTNSSIFTTKNIFNGDTDLGINVDPSYDVYKVKSILKKDYSHIMNSVSGEELESIKHYTGSGYGTINNTFRRMVNTIDSDDMDSNSPEYLSLVNALQKSKGMLQVFDRIGEEMRSPKGMYTFRGTAFSDKDLWGQFDIDKDFIDPGVMSTSIDPAVNFASSSYTYAVKFVIYIPKGSIILPALDYSSHDNEKEIILPPMSVLRPLEVKQFGDDVKGGKVYTCMYIGTAYKDFYEKLEKKLKRIESMKEERKIKPKTLYNPHEKYGFGDLSADQIKAAGKLIKDKKIKVSLAKPMKEKK